VLLFTQLSKVEDEAMPVGSSAPAVRAPAATPPPAPAPAPAAEAPAPDEPPVEPVVTPMGRPEPEAAEPLPAIAEKRAASAKNVKKKKPPKKRAAKPENNGYMLDPFTNKRLDPAAPR
jgi:hypothetical protein